MGQTIKIGNKNLKELSQNEVLEIAIIESAHLSFEHNGEKIWGYPDILDFNNSMFSDTLVIDFQQKRLSDGMDGKVLVFFLNYKDHSYHYHFKDDPNNFMRSNRLKMKSIKYLIDKGYDVPLY